MRVHYSGYRKYGVLSFRYEFDGDENVYVLREGDRLDVLSYRFYGTPELWWYLAYVNGIMNPLELEVGKVLVIPKFKKLFVG